MPNSSDRTKLLRLLVEACELEHALCCSYLYSAFSLKRELVEGLNWRQQQTTRRWASQIYHVAAQEMLHLAQAWNILNACGGAPHYSRPSFPQPAKHFPLNVALTLNGLSASTLDRFLIYERPHDEPVLEASKSNIDLWPIEEDFEFDTVGALYGEIAHLICESDEKTLFIGSHDLQADQGLVDFYDIIPVHDKHSALAAIERITEQGEGPAESREDGHFGVFCQIRDEFRNLDFEPSLPVTDNPYITRTLHQRIVGSEAAFACSSLTACEITCPSARYAIDVFNDVYVAMLQALEHVFAAGGRRTTAQVRISRKALELMITVVKPLGEAICRMPSGSEGRNAGPSFEIPPHVSFPRDSEVAETILDQRLLQIGDRVRLLLRTHDASAVHSQISSVGVHLTRIATSDAENTLK